MCTIIRYLYPNHAVWFGENKNSFTVQKIEILPSFQKMLDDGSLFCSVKCLI